MQFNLHSYDCACPSPPNVVADLVDLPAGMDDPSTVHWRVISTVRACEDNKENIKRFFGQNTASLDTCKIECMSHRKCRALDWYKDSKWCNLYTKECKHPQLVRQGSSAYAMEGEVCAQPGSRNGMMGILGDADKYVCNAVQAVLAHLVNVSQIIQSHSGVQSGPPLLTFNFTIVSRAGHRFWQKHDAVRKLQPSGRVTENLDTVRHRTENSDTVRGKQEKEQASFIHPRYHNALADTPRQESSKHRRRATGVPGAKNYTIPAHPRPGKRCASAKRDLGDDLLTVAALVPIGPYAFEKRKIIRRYLSDPAHKLRSRQLHRKIKTSSSHKRQPLFKHFMATQAALANLKKYKHIDYTGYKWGWFETHLAKPLDDPRAVCVEVIFVVSYSEHRHLPFSFSCEITSVWAYFRWV